MLFVGRKIVPPALMASPSHPVAIFKKHNDVIDRVTFWGLDDRRTWRFGQHPLPLDANSNPKPAYAAIVNDPGPPR